MLKRKRKYHCSRCGFLYLRVSNGRWIKSICGNSDDADARLVLTKFESSK